MALLIVTPSKCDASSSCTDLPGWPLVQRPWLIGVQQKHAQPAFPFEFNVIQGQVFTLKLPIHQHLGSAVVWRLEGVRLEVKTGQQNRHVLFVFLLS